MKITRGKSMGVRIGGLLGLWLALVFFAVGNARIQPPTDDKGRYPEFSTALALATFDFAWTLVRDTHYDENMNGVDWDAIRVELRPQAAQAANNRELRRVLNEMVGRLKLSHFGIIPAEQVDALVEPGAARKMPISKSRNKKNLKASGENKPAESVGGAVKQGKTGPAQKKVQDVSAGSERPPGKVQEIGKPKIAGAEQTGALRMRGEIKREREDRKERAAAGDAYGGIGLDVRVLAGEVVVTKVKEDGAAFSAGVRTGWVVDAIDDRSMPELLAKLGVAGEGGTLKLMVWQAITGMFHGRVGSTVELKLRDGEDIETVRVIERSARHGQTIKFGNLPPMRVETEVYLLAERQPAVSAGARIGVIGFNLWMFPMIKPFGAALERFADADGIIIDLRGNLGGVAALVMRTGGYFIAEKLPLGMMRQRGQELSFNINPQLVSASLKRVKPYAGPVVILVDEISASTSELFASGMQAQGRVRIIGVTSAGAALPAAMDRLPNGDVLLHAIADLIDPNGESVEGRGVIPDDEVFLTRESLLQGHDQQLEAAAAWIEANLDYQWRGSGALENEAK